MSPLQEILGFLGNPALDGSLLIVLVIFEIYLIYIESDVRNTAKASHAVEIKTYEMYKTWIETTEKRKAEARDKAAATRAAKRAAAQPPVPEGQTPPPMIMEEESEEESNS